MEELGSFVRRSIASDVALVVIARVTLILEVGTKGDCVNHTAKVTLVETAEAVGLIQFADRISDVIEFGNDSVLNFAQTDDQPDNEQRGDENEFSADDEASFIAQELLQHEGFLLRSVDMSPHECRLPS
jgi:hypothetical protein